MKMLLTISAAEGGEDSALFVKDLAQAYVKMSQKFGWRHRVVISVFGQIQIEFDGEDLLQLKSEAGGHRIQRVPPTERKGRVHTSTVTVSVLGQGTECKISIIPKSELKIEWYSGTGAGGQHRNKHQNSIRLTHIPTGMMETAQCRSRENSYQEAYTKLYSRVLKQIQSGLNDQLSLTRKTQVGSGMRGDKIRTYRFQDNIATDHRTTKKAPLSKVLDGNFELLS